MGLGGERKRKMKPEQFLEQWKRDNLGSRARQEDVPKLLAQLLGDAEKLDISATELSGAAGGGLVKFIVAGIRESIENEL